jgi:serine/threonine-protein kinase
VKNDFIDIENIMNNLAAATTEKMNILFVDDEETIVNSLRLLFRRQKNMNIFITTEQSKAIDIINQNKIHVVVSDMRMPGRNRAE